MKINIEEYINEFEQVNDDLYFYDKMFKTRNIDDVKKFILYEIFKKVKENNKETYKNDFTDIVKILNIEVETNG